MFRVVVPNQQLSASEGSSAVTRRYVERLCYVILNSFFNWIKEPSWPAEQLRDTYLLSFTFSH